MAHQSQYDAERRRAHVRKRHWAVWIVGAMILVGIASIAWNMMPDFGKKPTPAIVMTCGSTKAMVMPNAHQPIIVPGNCTTPEIIRPQSATRFWVEFYAPIQIRKAYATGEIQDFTDRKAWEEHFGGRILMFQFKNTGNDPVAITIHTN